MKVEHVSNWSEPNFYKRLVQVLANEKIEVIDVKYSTAPLNDEDYPIEYSALVLYEDKLENERTVEIEQVYRVMDGNPPVFGKVIKMTANKYWDDYWEEEENNE